MPSAFESWKQGTVAGGLFNPVGNYLFGKDSPGKELKRIFGGGSDDTFASDLLAKITREQWNDYKARFVPIENALVNQGQNPDFAGRGATARGRVDRAFDTSRGELDRRLTGLNSAMTPDQKTSFDRNFNISRGLADVEAQNRSRADIRNEQMEILTGSTPRASIMPPGGGLPASGA